MWFKKEESPQSPSDSIRQVVVSCEKCRALFFREDCQVVKKSSVLQSRKIYFCPTHNVKYDEVCYGQYYKNIPAHQVEVTESGKEIKQKKCK